MRLVMYRTFGSDGLYRRGKAFNYKSDAQDEAVRLRKGGILARVIKSTSPVKYTVWMREPRGKWK